ncbi:MAG: hypothetical protein EOM22_17695 [Gammaproteobacteria bacterium]|nr:hypothetical protein [Gammaproteobacteria bacterium]
MEDIDTVDSAATASVGDRLVTMAVHGDSVLMGISYRQWLIGQALAGTTAESSMSPTLDAELAIKAADAVIAMLDAETGRDTRTADLFETEHQCCGGCKS